jgi:hypothetical protein
LESNLPVEVQTEFERRRGLASWELREEKLRRSTAAQQKRAEAYLLLMREVETRLGQGESVEQATLAVAARAKVKAKTLAMYWAKVNKLPSTEWFAELLDGRKGRGPSGSVNDYYYQRMKLVVTKGGRDISFANAYYKVRTLALADGVKLAPCSTYRRHFNKVEDANVIDQLKNGRKRVFQRYPMQIRDHGAPNHAWAIDAHRLNYRTRCPDGKIRRLYLLGIIDVSTKKWLVIRLAVSENQQELLAAFAEAFRKYGIPKHIILDNGMGNCGKWLMGGLKTYRKRSVRVDEVEGQLRKCGAEIHLKTPKWAWANPIEANWRPLSEILMHPLLREGYTGRDALSKPEDYGGHVAWDTLFEVLSTTVAMINGMVRESETRSRNDVYDEWWSLNVDQVRRPSQQQLRLLACAVQAAKVRQGGITFNKRRYEYPEVICGYNGQMVQVRFDPTVKSPESVYLEDLAGVFLCEAPRIDAVGLFDSAAGAAHAERRNSFLKDTNAAANAFLGQFDVQQENARLLEAARTIYGGAESAVTCGTLDRSDVERTREKQAKRDAEAVAAAQARVGKEALTVLRRLSDERLH